MEHAWVRSTTSEAFLKGRGADTWECAGCACAVRSFQPPVAHEEYMWAWVRRRRSVGVPYSGHLSQEDWLKRPIADGDLKVTEVPADCREAMVLNVMTS